MPLPCVARAVGARVQEHFGGGGGAGDRAVEAVGDLEVDCWTARIALSS
jgi:hypothetical protein